MNGFPNNPRIINVIQGEFEICHSKDVVLSTILGSCVAVCMYDPIQNVGGLNHYLLPHDGTSGPQERKYGAMAMELLINGLLRRGAERANLKAKVFGGADVTSKFSGIGARNVDFAFSFLEREGFEVVTHLTRGTNALRVHFHGFSGTARAMKIPATQVVEPKVPVTTEKKSAPAGGIELF
ncbi:MAG: chemotaxis protein CheD [Litoreibacter sp.]|nr:chemotaxis protein CheD [Litoreibacter sp.]